MALALNQTDSTTGLCSNCTTALGGRRAANDETLGSIPVSITVPGSGSGSVEFICIIPAGTSGDSGTFTIRLNVTTTNMFLSINVSGTSIDRVNSACTFQAGLVTSGAWDNRDLSVSGVKTIPANTSTTTFAAGDKVRVCILVDNSSMSDQSFSFTPDQVIDTPFTAVTQPNPNVSDSVTLTESVTARMNPMLFNVSDNVTITESVGRNLKLFPNPFDSVTLTESINPNLIVMPNPFDSVTVTESVRPHPLIFPVVFDSVTLTESVINLLTRLNISADDTVTLTESVSLTLITAGASPEINVSDSVTVSDDTLRVHLLVFPNVQDGVTVTESQVMNLKVMPNVNDTVTTTESQTVTVVSVTGLSINAFDTVTTTDASTTVLPFLALFVSDEITTSESVTVGPLVEVTPSVGETPAGRSKRRRERIVARYKGSEYLFDSPEQLQDFVDSVRTPGQKKRGKKPAVKIIVPQGIEKELSSFDLPSLQKALSGFDFGEAIRLWNRYESLRDSQRVGVEQSREFREQQALRMQIEMEDEELLLL